MSRSDANEYNFSRRSKTGRPGFESFTDETGKQHYFHVNDIDGNALLFSQAYTTVQARDTGIASVTKNSVKPDKFERITDEGQPYFLIRAGNMKEIARSRYFATVGDMDQAIGWLLNPAGSGVAGAGAAHASGLGAGAVQNPADVISDANSRASATGQINSQGTDAISSAVKSASSNLKWLWWIVLLLLLVALLWMMRGCMGGAAETVGSAATSAFEGVSIVANAEIEAASYALGA